MKHATQLLLLATLVGACSSEEGTSYAGSDPADPEPGAGLVEELNAAIAELMARPEHDAEQIEVQHILIGVGGHPRLAQVTRSRAEGEELTAALWERIQNAEEFDDLVRANTDDAYPGIYTMTTGQSDPASQLYARADMAKSFGDVAWRLEVGQVGIAAYDRQGNSSPFGWHVIKRLR